MLFLRPIIIPIVGLLLAAPAAAAPRPEVQRISEADPAVRAMPGPEAFQLGPGDRISIRVWRHDDLDMDVAVAPDGTITYPLVGAIQVAGLTYPQLMSRLSEAIREYYTDPQVTVNLLDVQSQKVFVVGEVLSPTVLHLSTPTSILEALAVAGGINPDARTRNVLLVRGGLGEPQLYAVDVNALLNAGDMNQMVYLQKGDIVVVPTKTITNVARFFRSVQSVLAPFVAGSAIYRNALGGGAQGTSSVLE